MTKFTIRIIFLFSLILCANSSWGGQLKAYVSAFAVTGAPNRDELKTALQTLMMSRLTGDTIIAVDSPAGVDITVTGSYVVFGKVFSIDAVAKNSSGNVVARAFAQGDSQDELIPAVGKLAKSLAEEVAKTYVPASSPQHPPTSAPQEKSAATDIVRKETASAAVPDIVRPKEVERSAGAGWVSQRLAGAMTGIAQGRTLPNGEREIFLAGVRTIRYYRQGKDMKLIAEVSLDNDEKILSIDSADLDGDGVPEVYLTVLSGDYLASQVWVPSDNTLKKVAGKLAYFFRGIALDGKGKKIYAQEKGIDGEYYGDVYELVKSGDAFMLKNSIKLPKFGNLYNFNRFTDAQGKSNFILFNPDGYLLVYSPERELLWKSSDKFGGSELYFTRPPSSSVTVSTAASRTVFMDQRIEVTGDGEIMVPQNAGFWVIGINRSYSKNSVFCFTWNGSSLEEKWRTRQGQNYLADFAYDARTKELLLLEVVQKEGLVEKGASAVYLKKVE